MSQQTRQHVVLAVQAIEGKKGENVVILEMDRNAGAFTDYFVLCTGTNPRQIQAISDDIERKLTEAGTRPNSLEGYNQAEWVLVDYVDFVVHIFSERARQFYDLERLWKSAKRLKPADLKKMPAAAKPAKKALKKSAAKKRTSKTATTARGGKTSRVRANSKKNTRKRA
ncbi:MAG TPA: ribosome silencing factor [Candidatus Angelobacter sp.]|nr:ribosome silencing factor [Candidatus Angelobacter sp.]